MDQMAILNLAGDAKRRSFGAEPTRGLIHRNPWDGQAPSDWLSAP